MLSGVFLNVFLNWMFIFGHLGAPAWGLFGAGLATLLSRIVTTALLFWFIYAGQWRPSEPLILGKLWWKEQGAILRLGIPAGFQLTCEMGVFAGVAILVGLLGAIPLAAHQIAMTCASTTYMVPLGIAMAATVRVAQALGAGKPHLLRAIATGAWGVGIVFMMVFAAFFLLANTLIASAFVRDPNVIQLAASLLVIAGIFQLMDGVQVVGTGLLRGLHDTKGPMFITIAAYWFLALPLGAWLTFSVGMGARGIWIGLASGLTVAAVMLVKRFLKRIASPF